MVELASQTIVVCFEDLKNIVGQTILLGDAYEVGMEKVGLEVGIAIVGFSLANLIG